MKVQAVFVQKPKPQIKTVQQQRNRREPIRLPDHRSLLPFCCAVCSLFIGVLLFVLRKDAVSDALYGLYQSYMSTIGTSFFARLAGAFLPTVGAGLCIVYIGASPIAGYAVLPFLALRAAVVGAVAGWLTGVFYTTGTDYYFVCFYPAKALQLIGLSLLAQRALRLSGYIKSRLRRDSFQHESILQPYLTACVPGFGCLLLSSILDVLLQQWFSSSFPLVLS